MAEQSLALNKNPFKTYEEMINNEDCINLINWVKNRYYKFLDSNDVDSYCMQASWYAWLKYDESRGTKFTSFLVYMVDRKLCDLYYRSKEKYKNNKGVDKKYYKKIAKNHQDNQKNSILVKEILDNLTEEERELLNDRYIKNLSTIEIAKSKNLSPQSIRLKIKSALRRCKLSISS